MKVISVNVGLPREISWKGRKVRTAIFKEPVEGRVSLRSLNLDGDRQADLKVHGGPSKAVYGYPTEHYGFWRSTFPSMQLPFGMFGENLTTEGLSETSLNIGDTFRVGSAVLQITEPRLPCYKLGLKFGRDDVLKILLQNRRTGFYFAVLREGEVGAGDSIEALARDPNNVTVRDIVELYLQRRIDMATFERVSKIDALPESWKLHFQDRVNSR